MTSCLVAGALWDLTGDVGLAPFILDRDLLDANPGSELTDGATAAATTSLGAMLLNVSWSHGPGSVLGPLTTPAAGTLRAALIDTERLFDPLNADSALRLTLKPGIPIRLTADAAPAFTGVLRTWGHDLASSESVLELVGPLAEIAAHGFPLEGVTLPSDAVNVQAAAVFAAAGWPASRLDMAGASSFSMLSSAGPGYVTLTGKSPLDALGRLRLADLAEMTETRDGRIRWRSPGWPNVPDPTALINCGGVILEGLVSAMDAARVRNVVSIPDEHPFGLVIGEFTRRPDLGRRVLEASAASLRLAALALPYGDVTAAQAAIFTMNPPGLDPVDAYHLMLGTPEGAVMWDTGIVVIAPTTANVGPGAYAGTPALVEGDQYFWRIRMRDAASGTWHPWLGAGFVITPTGTTDYEPQYTHWADIILDALADLRPLTALGTIRPQTAAEVASIALAEAGDRWFVIDDHVSPALAIEVRVHGIRARLVPGSVAGEPGRLEVDAITEDVAA